MRSTPQKSWSQIVIAFITFVSFHSQYFFILFFLKISFHQNCAYNVQPYLSEQCLPYV